MQVQKLQNIDFMNLHSVQKAVCWNALNIYVKYLEMLWDILPNLGLTLDKTHQFST